MIINSSSNNLPEVLKLWCVSQIVTIVKKTRENDIKIIIHLLKSYHGLTNCFNGKSCKGGAERSYLLPWLPNFYYYW